MRGILVVLFLCSVVSFASAESKLAAISPTEITGGKPNTNTPIIHHRPRKLTGTLTIGDNKFDFASGGSGWSVPYGSYPITPSEVGSWGERHHAIGINGNEIPDVELGRIRSGIEIHGASGSLHSAGCIVVDSAVYDKLSHLIFDLIKNAGQAFIHIGPTGAAITATKESPLPAYVYLPEKVGEDDSPNHHHAHSKHAHRHHEKRVHYAHHHHHRST